MELAKILFVLRYEDVAHRFKIFRGTPRSELLSSNRDALRMDRFMDEDDDQALLSSWTPPGTRLKVRSTSGEKASWRLRDFAATVSRA